MSLCGERFRLVFARSLFGVTNSCRINGSPPDFISLSG